MKCAANIDISSWGKKADQTSYKKLPLSGRNYALDNPLKYSTSPTFLSLKGQSWKIWILQYLLCLITPLQHIDNLDLKVRNFIK